MIFIDRNGLIVRYQTDLDRPRKQPLSVGVIRVNLPDKDELVFSNDAIVTLVPVVIPIILLQGDRTVMADETLGTDDEHSIS